MRRLRRCIFEQSLEPEMTEASPFVSAAHVQLPSLLPMRSRPISTLLPLLIVFYSFLLLPPETEFMLFGVRLFGYRLAVLLMSPAALWIMIRDSKGGVNTIDIGIGFLSFWMLLSFVVIYGLEQGLVRGLGTVIDCGLCYLVARASISTPDELRRFLILIVPGLLFAGGLLLLESAAGQYIYRPLAAKIFGSVTLFKAGEEVTSSLQFDAQYRLGMLRAMGPFDHPILAGTIMLGFLPLFYFSGLRGRPYLMGLLMALTGLLSLSSAAILGFLFAAGAIAIYHAKPYIPKLSWWTVTALFVMLLVVAHVGSKNGIISVITRLSLSPETGNYRQLIWQFGVMNVEKNPWFGIGYNNWERVSWMYAETIDAHFLLLAIRYGIAVPVVLLAGIFFGVGRLGVLINKLPLREQPIMIGINIAIMMFVMVGQTVTYFGASQLVFMSFLGSLAAMVSWAERTVKADRQWSLVQARHQIYRSQLALAQGAVQA